MDIVSKQEVRSIYDNLIKSLDLSPVDEDAFVGRLHLRAALLHGFETDVVEIIISRTDESLVLPFYNISGLIH